MAIYMKYGSVNGDVDTKGYEKWIMLHSFQWGTGRAIQTATGSGANRQGTHASVSEITVTKSLDPASGHLQRDSLDGKLNTKVEIKFTLADSENRCYLAFELHDTGVSGYSISHGPKTLTATQAKACKKAWARFILEHEKALSNGERIPIHDLRLLTVELFPGSEFTPTNRK